MGKGQDGTGNGDKTEIKKTTRLHRSDHVTLRRFAAGILSAAAMFYIDFTSPEGKTYRNDLSKHKLIQSCPICGSEQQIMLDESLELFFPKNPSEIELLPVKRTVK